MKLNSPVKILSCRENLNPHLAGFSKLLGTYNTHLSGLNELFGSYNTRSSGFCKLLQSYNTHLYYLNNLFESYNGHFSANSTIVKSSSVIVLGKMPHVSSTNVISNVITLLEVVTCYILPVKVLFVTLTSFVQPAN